LCDGLNSTVISVCRDKRPKLCSSQNWLIGEGQIELIHDKFQVDKWACLQSHSGYKVVFYLGNSGNCDTCEGFEIWDPKGAQSSGLLNGKEFDLAYTRQGFPKTTGTLFWKPFQDIKRGLPFEQR
jgi:hypothetical protein